MSEAIKQALELCLKQLYHDGVSTEPAHPKRIAATAAEQALAALSADQPKPVAWVEVVNQYEGPYNFHGMELLPKGKHNLYASPIAAPASQMTPLTDSQIQDVMVAVFDYAFISDGIDNATGVLRDEQRAQMREQDRKIREMLRTLLSATSQPSATIHNNALNYQASDPFRIWWEENYRKLSGHSIYSKCAATWNAALRQQAPANSEDAKDGPREVVTLNGRELKDLLASAWPDGDDEDQAETEITLIAYDKPFKSTEGDDMPAGIYFYWDEYPEEGIVLIKEDGGAK